MFFIKECLNSEIALNWNYLWRTKEYGQCRLLQVFDKCATGWEPARSLFHERIELHNEPKPDHPNRVSCGMHNIAQVQVTTREEQKRCCNSLITLTSYHKF